MFFPAFARAPPNHYWFFPKFIPLHLICIQVSDDSTGRRGAVIVFGDEVSIQSDQDSWTTENHSVVEAFVAGPDGTLQQRVSLNLEAIPE